MTRKITTTLSTSEKQSFSEWLECLAEPLARASEWHVAPNVDDELSTAAPGLIVTARRHPQAKFAHTLNLYLTWPDKMIRQFMRCPERYVEVYNDYGPSVFEDLAGISWLDVQGGSQHPGHMQFILLREFGREGHIPFNIPVHHVHFNIAGDFPRV